MLFSGFLLIRLLRHPADELRMIPRSFFNYVTEQMPHLFRITHGIDRDILLYWNRAKMSIDSSAQTIDFLRN